MVKDVNIKSSVIAEGLAKKVRVGRFKSKSRYDKVKGHRQPITTIKITEITLGSAKAKKEEKAEVAETKVETKTAKSVKKVSKKKEEK